LQTSIGQDYFCDTGNTGPRVANTFFVNDPLWDGAGCSGGSSCCEFNTPPWFCKTLPLGANSFRTIEGNYVDGVSVTHGAAGSRQHIWTFAGASHQSNDSGSTSSLSFVCACTNPTLNWPYQTSIGEDYFCDTGNTGMRIANTFFVDDPLWDGAGCSGGSSCCEFNTPPWFCKTLPQPTTDAIEIRLCFVDAPNDADTPIQLIEIYTQ